MEPIIAEATINKYNKGGTIIINELIISKGAIFCQETSKKFSVHESPSTRLIIH